jgi:catechol 2,3-dioxygenase-like lactoylglutathione lyase family enzyme
MLALSLVTFEQPSGSTLIFSVCDRILSLHLIPLADKSTADPPHHAYRHVALQVPDLRTVLGVLLTGGVRVLQVDFEGNQREVTSNDDPLDFGVGSLFVHDPDGNLIEFLQLGHGIFTPEMQSPASAVPL